MDPDPAGKGRGAAEPNPDRAGDNSAAAERSVPGKPSYAVGSKVRISGLSSRPDLNDKLATVMGDGVDSTGMLRYTVKLENGQTKKLKPACLIPISGDVAAAATAAATAAAASVAATAAAATIATAAVSGAASAE